MDSENTSFNRIEAWRRECFRRERQMILIGVATGAGGIGTGYALFITLHSRRAPTCTQLPEHASGHLGTFWMGVGLAALAALAIEWLRGRARREEGAESFALPQVLSLLVLLGVFELFIMAIHGLLEVPWESCLSAVFGADSFRAWWNLTAFAGLWVLLGAMLAGCLAWGIAQAPTTLGQQLMWSFKIGAMSGVIYVPMTVVAYGLLVRLGWGLWAYIASEG